MNGTEITKLLWTVKATWPTFQVMEDQLPAQIQVWGALVGEFTFEEAAGALMRLAAAGREFAPAPGQLRQTLLAAAGTLAPDSDQALAEVQHEIRRVGYIGRPEWSHPAIGAAVDAFGGWAEVCASTNPEAFRAHFRQLYAAAATREDRDVTTPRAAQEALSGVRRHEFSADRPRELGR
jgi:hypothetical protein